MPEAATAVQPDAPCMPAGPPGEDALELELLRAAVLADWRPRDAYERHWTGELVAGMHRQQCLRRLKLKALAAAEQQSPPTEATLRGLLAFARYGARIDHDIGRALRALRVLKGRPDAHLAETPPRTSEPERPAAAPRRTPEPEPRAEAIDAVMAEAGTPAPLNRHERRRLDALARKAQRQAA